MTGIIPALRVIERRISAVECVRYYSPRGRRWGVCDRRFYRQ
jgi:hypothetical protein